MAGRLRNEAWSDDGGNSFWVPSELAPTSSGLTRRRFLKAAVATAAAAGSGVVPMATAAAAVGPAPGLVIQPRSAWAHGLPHPGTLPAERPGDVRCLLVHHSALRSDYAPHEVAQQIREFHALHTAPPRRWPDVAYNFLVDRFGGIWEGRAGSLSRPVKSDASGGSQGFALTCCLIGNFHAQPPSAAAVDSLTALLAWLAQRYGVDTRPGATTSFVSRGSNRWPAGSHITTTTIAGHRDMSLTVCPGDAAYALVRGSLPARVHAAATPTWSGWAPLADRVASAAGAASWGPGRSDVFALGPLGTLVHAWFTTHDGWSPRDRLQDLGAPPGLGLTSAPSVVARAHGQLNVLVRASDHALWHRYYVSGRGWSAWEHLGGILTSAPAAVSWGPTHLAVFARGRDDRVWQCTYEHGWRGWRLVGGHATSAPSATSRGDGHLDLVVRGRDRALWHRSYRRGAGWSAWTSLGGLLDGEGRPEIVADGNVRLDVFVTGTNQALYRRSWEPGRGWFPGGYERLGHPGGPLDSGTAAVVLRPLHLEVYARSGATLYHRWQV